MKLPFKTASLALCLLVFQCPRSWAQQTINYTDGQNSSSPIVITGTTNPLTLNIDSGSATQSGTISDSSGVYGVVYKTGSGTLALTGTNTYGGATMVEYGTLELLGAGATITQPNSIIYVGRGSGSNSTLLLTGGAQVSDYDAYLGSLANSSGNATVTGTGSYWNNTDNLYVGYFGLGNLTISNGGRISNILGIVGYVPTGSGTVTVTGAGSSWTNSGTLTLGESGTASMIVADGGKVSNTDGYIGLGSLGVGNVTVTGTWINSNNLTVGSYGQGTLTISAGGMVSDQTPFIGDNAGSTGSVIVSGAGALWVNSSGTLVLGNYGSGSLTVTNGGSVQTGSGPGTLILGQNSGAVGSLNVGAGSTFADVNGYISFSAGSTGYSTVTGTWTNTSNLYVGYSGTGSLTIGTGGTVTDQIGYIGYNTNVTGYSTVSGTWANAGNLYVGYSGTGSLTISSGGSVLDQNGYIAYNPGSSFNNIPSSAGAATVTGAGSSWTSTGTFIVGSWGPGTLTVANGGQVVDSDGYIGFNAATGFGDVAAASGFATVTGTGALWSSSHSLVVGLGGSGTLVISNGGAVQVGGGTGTLVLAQSPGSNGTLIIGNADLGVGGLSGTLQASTVVGGSGGAVVNFNASDVYTFAANLTGNLSVNEMGNGITILTGTNTYAGTTTISQGILEVDGANARLAPGGTGVIYVGANTGAGGYSQLYVFEGGQVVNNLTSIGNAAGGGAATVLGANSSLTSTTLYVGYSTSGTLNILNYGQVQDQDAYIGYNGPTSDSPVSTGEVTVRDHSSWIGSNNLYVGYYGTATLNVSLGSVITDNNSYIGYASGSSGSVTIMDSGSSWTSTGSLVVGLNSTGTLAISNGAVVSDRDGFMGYNAGGSSSPASTGYVTVTDPGSVWNNINSLVVGNSGTGTLNISNGGVVTTGTTAYFGPGAGASVGVNAGATGYVSVTGSGSAWNDIGNLNIGVSGTGTLLVSNGAVMTTGTTAYFGPVSANIGVNTGSVGYVAVTGTGSSWSNHGSLNIGVSGTGTLLVSDSGTVSSNGGVITVGGSSTGTLTISNGGTVSSGSGTIGSSFSGRGYVSVTGTGSSWTNLGSLTIGGGGTGTLTVSNGGTISSYGGIIGGTGSGYVSVTGSGSAWTNTNSLIVGGSGSGTLTLAEGSLLQVGTDGSGTLILAQNFGSRGVLNIGSDQLGISDLSGTLEVGAITGGAGTAVVNFGQYDIYTVAANMTGNLNVNVYGNGITLLTGASSYTGTTTISKGILELSGNNASLLNYGTLYAGYNNGVNGRGEMFVLNGSHAFSSQTYIGYNTNSFGEAIVRGAGSLWTAGNAYVGYSGTGSLTIDSQGLFSADNLYIGGNTDGQGEVAVSGTTSTLNATNLYVGYSGTGTLSASYYGQISDQIAYIGYNLNSSGTMLVSDPGTASSSNVLYVGYSGTATLVVSNGAQVSGTTTYLGYTSFGSGTMTLTDPGSSLSGNQSLFVGEYGAGTVLVSNGAQIAGHDATVGDNAGSQGNVTVTGSGSFWNNNFGTLTLGNSGTATLSISGGGQVADSSGIIANNAGSQGSATITGSGSFWNNTGGLTVGRSGSGTLTLADNGTVQMGGGTGTLVLAQNAGSSGTLNIGVGGTAGTLLAQAIAGGAGRATVNFNESGTLTFMPTLTGDLSVNQIGTGTTILTGTNSYTGGMTIRQGTLAVSGTGTSLTTISTNLGYNDGDTGQLLISAGGQVSNILASIGNASDGTGSVTVTGSGSSWKTSDIYLNVGAFGSGALNISNGGAVQIGSGTGTLLLGQSAGSSGTLTIGNGSLSGTLQASTVTGGMGTAQVIFSETDPSYTFAANMTGGLSVNQTGTGTTILTGANSYTGGTVITAGVLQGNTQSLPGNILDNASLVFNQGLFGVYFGNISGTGAFTKTGTGTLMFTGTNTYTGGTTISAGTLQAGSSAGLRSGSTGADYAINGGALDLNNYNLTMSSLSGTGGAIALGTATLTVNQSGTTTFAGSITGTGGFTKMGSGTLTLSGSSNFNGPLSPNEGTLIITGQVTNASTSGIATTGTVSTVIVTGAGASWTDSMDTLIGLNGGTGNLIISNGGAVSDTFSLVGRNQVNDTGSVTVTGTGSTWTHSQGLVIGTGGVGSMLVADGGHVSNTDGTVGGNAGSNGTVRVTGQNSLWTSTSYLLVGNSGAGTLSVDSGGTVQVGSSGTGAITLGNSGTGSGILNIGAAVGQTALDPGTVEAGTITGGSGGGVVNFNHAGTSYTFAPILAGNLSVQQNSGTTVLTGTNTYTGGTAVNAGTLEVSNNSALGSGVVNVAGGNLQINSGYTVTNTITLSGGSLSQEVTAHTQLSTLHNYVSAFSGGTSTEAQLLAGQASANGNLVGSFSHSSTAGNDSLRVSDVFTLSGVPVVDANTGQTDTFVLQLHLDPSLLTSDTYLEWLDPATNQWINAILGNYGGTATFINGAYDPLTDFQLGYYGVDLSTGTAWAVLDHNSSFAVVSTPEPSTWLLLGLGLSTLAFYRRRAR